MATIKGLGAVKERSLIVIVPEGADKSRHPVDVQIDQSLFNPDKIASGAKSADPNPHLGLSSPQYYSPDQVVKMREAAGDKVFKAEIDGKMYEILGIKADLIRASNGKGFVVNTAAPMGPTANRQFGENTLIAQTKVTEAVINRNSELRAEKESVAEAAKTEKTVEQTASKEMDSPEL